MQAAGVAFPFENKSHRLLASQYAITEMQFIKKLSFGERYNMQNYLGNRNIFLFKILLSSAF